MFKYIRNLNGSIGTPEVIEIPVSRHETIPEGTLGCFFETQIDFYNGGMSGRSYITVEPKVSGDNKDTLKVIKALPGMLFEVPLVEVYDEVTIMAGMLVSSRENSNSKHVYVCPESGSFIEVINADGYEKTGKILVTFI